MSDCPQTHRYRAGADIGGTFTDLIVIDTSTGAFHIGKTLTMPATQRTPVVLR